MPQLCRVLLLALSCLVFAIMFGFPGSLLTAFSGGTLANGINQLLFLKASFCLRREQKEDPNENQPGLRQHRRSMVKHRGAPAVRYSLYMFTQGQIKIIRASPEGWCKCEVWPVEQGCNNGPFVDHDSNALLSPTDEESGAQAPFHWHDLLSCALCRSQLLEVFKGFVKILVFSPSDVTRPQDSDDAAGGNGEFWFVWPPQPPHQSGEHRPVWVARRGAPVFAEGVRVSFRLSVSVAWGERAHSCSPWPLPLPASVVQVFTAALGFFLKH